MKSSGGGRPNTVRVITGASGQIGGVLTRALADKYGPRQVRAIFRKRRGTAADLDIAWVNGDILDAATARDLRLWKWELQRFTDRPGLTITVCHYPPGTSKWSGSISPPMSFTGTGTTRSAPHRPAVVNHLIRDNALPYPFGVFGALTRGPKGALFYLYFTKSARKTRSCPTNWNWSSSSRASSRPCGSRLWTSRTLPARGR